MPRSILRLNRVAEPRAVRRRLVPCSLNLLPEAARGEHFNRQPIGDVQEIAVTSDQHIGQSVDSPLTMDSFQAMLVSGEKPPYASWTFVVIPPELARRWGSGPIAVRGTISGQPFRGTASKGEGMLKVPVPKALREKAGVRCGETVEVALELDPDPGSVDLPDELRAVLEADPEVAGLYGALPPSQRRAWAAYVAEARRPETRRRRAAKAPDGIRARAFPR